MAKTLVERYEQLLAQDPASSVFVELAKALIAKGEPARAITVCEQGISHHPNSVTGRVLWGKALIFLGRPAEAMAQFDQAIAIDKENAYAYNLISEVLLQRGLYRSALPILRKALSLQPNDARVRGWMEQAQAALSGGPAPEFGDLNTLEPKSPEESAPPAETAGSEAAPEAEAKAPEAVETQAPVDPVEEAPAPEAKTAAAEPAPSAPPELAAEPVSVVEVAPDEPTLVAAVDVGAPPPTIELPDVALPFDEEPPATIEIRPELEGVEAVDAEAAPADGGGLLGDLPPLETPAEAAAPEAEASASEEEASRPEVIEEAGSRRGLLEELPEVTAEARVAPAKAAAVARAPVVDIAAATAAYERELRQQLLPQGSTSFLSGRALKAVLAAAVVVLLLGAFLVVRAKQGGEALVATLNHAARLIEQDTASSRQEAISLLTRVVDLDADNTRAWALLADAHALNFADGDRPEERSQALDALNRPKVRTEQPGLALVVDARVADAQGREAALKALLAAKGESSEVQAFAGEVLLQQGKTKEALERLERALKLSPRNVRALVALGAYYRDESDPVNALKMYSTATKLAPEHPVARLGVAESRWALGQELESALADVEGLAGKAVPVAASERLSLVQCRLLTSLGRAGEARTMLAGKARGPLAYDFLLALGEANRAAGDMAAAQKAFEDALTMKPSSEEARAGLGRVLLDRDRAQDVLARVDGESHPVALVRAAAYARMADWKRVRTEVAHTRVDDRYPAEAIVYLARADAAEGERDRARDALEKTLPVTKTARTEVRTALAVMQWQDKSLDKASSLLESAVAEDSRNYEAPCALGRLLIARGTPDLALKPLTQAVERNGSHGEAREALGRALLALGRTDEALKQFEAWQLDNPAAPEAHKGFALALYHSGRMKDAEAASARAVKLAASDPEAHRVRSDILFALGDTKGGFGELENANRLDAKAPETFCDIALAFLRQGLVLNADKAFEAARREGPDVTCGRVGEHWVKDSGGRAAAKTLEEIADKAPTTWDKAFAQAAMARVLLAAGAVKEARAAADEAVKLAPFSGRNHLVLGQVALKQRDEAAALQAFSKAVELEPVDGLAWLALGDALVHDAAQTRRAVDAYQGFLKLAAASPEAGRVKKALPALERRAGGR